MGQATAPQGLTLDTGALIGYERKQHTILGTISTALKDGVHLTVPAACIAEAWRGGPRGATLARLLRFVTVEPLDVGLARTAGELLGATGMKDAVDASVVASAARRGDVVLTSDAGDISKLAAALPHVVVLQV